ncbi:MAG: Cytochrome [Devosia sp.]|uniref:c-type cytochrome n=1 Tax=Devosia sp. TaxID=1871048 RepID=UPI0026122C84|nr:c-type cytochrome [Devosia sp.]MDB5541635.1 Cytochrome [Devosia sp.]
MAHDRGPFKLSNPWPVIGWGVVAGALVVSVVLGFGVLSRFQQNAPTLDLWAAICRGLGITSDTAPATQPQPALNTPTRIAWTPSTLEQIASGDAERGAFIAMNCVACHGQRGVSGSDVYPTLAGMSPAVIYKQLDDFRTGKRPWGVMGGVAKALSDQDSADVAAYFASQPNGLPPVDGYRVPEPGRSLRETNPAKRLAFAGDPARGIPPCAACHGQGGYKIGAPALQQQRPDYIEAELQFFAQGVRANDIFGQMRNIAKQLTPDEMHALALFYSESGGPQASIR